MLTAEGTRKQTFPRAWSQYVYTEEDAQCRLMLASTMVCQNIGPAVAGSAGPVPPPLGYQSVISRDYRSVISRVTEQCMVTDQ